MRSGSRRSNYNVCWSKHSFTVGFVADLMWIVHVSLVWYSCAHMCAWMCGMVAEAGGVERASERAELFNLRLGWEISQGAMCHGEQAERGDLWEPNLKHCHDGSWKCVKVGGSVIFKDEPREKADRKQGQIWPRKNRRRKARRRMQGYFQPDTAVTSSTPYQRSHWRNCCSVHRV